MAADRPRLSIDLSTSQREALNRLIPWGLQNQLFSVIVDSLISYLERHGMTAVMVILERRLPLDELIKTLEALKK